MEEKDINYRESIEIISSMINRTRNRLNLGDGNIMLLWGCISVVVATLVGILIHITHNPVYNWLWFLIWIIGGPISARMSEAKEAEQGAKTYIDSLTTGIWTIVGYSGIICTAACLGMLLFLGKDIWILMFIYALLLIGIIEMIQGLIIREKSLIFGGAVGALAGLAVMIMVISCIPLYYNVLIPLFVIAFFFMMIVPGLILNHKAKKTHENA